MFLKSCQRKKKMLEYTYGKKHVFYSEKIHTRLVICSPVSLMIQERLRTVCNHLLAGVRLWTDPRACCPASRRTQRSQIGVLTALTNRLFKIAHKKAFYQRSQIGFLTALTNRPFLFCLLG